MHCHESSPAQSCTAAGSQQPLLGTLVFWSAFLGAAPCSALLYVPKVFLPSLDFVLSRALHHHLCFQSEFSLRLIWYINCRVLLYDLDDNILAFFPELINSFTVILSSFFCFFFVSSLSLFMLSVCCCLLYLRLPSCWQTSLQATEYGLFFSVSPNQVFLSCLQHFSYHCSLSESARQPPQTIQYTHVNLKLF